MNIKLRRICRLVVICTAWGFVAGCRNIDCPIENTVMVGSRLYFPAADDGEQAAAADTLLVTAVGTDSVLYLERTDAIITFPLRYTAGHDTLLLNFVRSGRIHTTDSVFIEHENRIHFENIDCPPAVFAEIRRVAWANQSSGRIWIDSVSISSPFVNYNETEHLQIFVHGRD